MVASRSFAHRDHVAPRANRRGKHTAGIAAVVWPAAAVRHPRSADCRDLGGGAHGRFAGIGSQPGHLFLVLTFVAGVLVAQVLLFGGRKPQAASMWAGAILLPAEVLVVSFATYYDCGTSPIAWSRNSRWVVSAWFLPASFWVQSWGRLAGLIYALSEGLLLWISGGLPAIRLEPIAEADADVLLAWIRGPKFCRRWAGDQLTFPLDRNQLARALRHGAGRETDPADLQGR